MAEERAFPPAPWGDAPLPAEGEIHRLDFGPLALWIRRVHNEVWLTHLGGDREAADGCALARVAQPPEEAEWRRWALAEGMGALRFLPALPDRLLVVKPEHPFTLLGNAQARVYTRVGAWVRVEAARRGDGRGTRLTEIPTERLSDTWWGGFVDGELAYWLTTRARRDLADELFEPHRVMCTLQLTNRSADDLPIEKLALRVEHLSVYERDGRLWAEEVLVDYQGEAEGSDIRMPDRPPREAAGAREITPARAQSPGFRARTFARIRALSGLGLGG